MRRIAPNIGLLMALLIGLSSSLGIWYEQHFCFCEGELHQSFYQELSDCCTNASADAQVHHCNAEKDCTSRGDCGESETVFWQLDVDYVPASWSVELPSLAVHTPIPVVPQFFISPRGLLTLPPNKAPPTRSALQRRVLLQSFLC